MFVNIFFVHAFSISRNYVFGNPDDQVSFFATGATILFVDLQFLDICYDTITMGTSQFFAFSTHVYS